MTAKKTEKPEQELPSMPFNEALKRVWAAKPMPKVKPKPTKPSEKKSK
jgi:hypothetical protein